MTIPDAVATLVGLLVLAPFVVAALYEDRLAALRRAFVLYGKHAPDCMESTPIDSPDMDLCTCHIWRIACEK